MKKQLIALSGKGSVGKSSTIKIVYSLLQKKYPTLTVVVEPLESAKEVRVVVRINGKRIGIESRGDTRGVVSRALSIFAESKCHIILCATRSRGSTWDAVEEFADQNKYEISRVEKIGEPVQTKQKGANKKCADGIFSVIDSLL
jgi:hypothetical protein